MSDLDRTDLPDVDVDALERHAPELLGVHATLVAFANEPVEENDQTWHAIARGMEDPRPVPITRLRSRALVLVAAAVLAISGGAIAYATARPVRGAVEHVIDWVTRAPDGPKPPIAPTPSAPRVDDRSEPSEDRRGEEGAKDEDNPAVSGADREGVEQRDGDDADEGTTTGGGVEPEVDTEGPSGEGPLVEEPDGDHAEAQETESTSGSGSSGSD